MDFAYPKPACGEQETRPEVLFKVHFLYFSLILTFVVLVVCVVVSLFTQKRPEEKVCRNIIMCYHTSRLCRVCIGRMVLWEDVSV